MISCSVTFYDPLYTERKSLLEGEEGLEKYDIFEGVDTILVEFSLVIYICLFQGDWQ